MASLVPVGDRFQDGEPPPAGRPSVGVDGDGRVGVDLVADRGALGDARSHPGIAGAGERDRRSFRAQVGGEVHGDVPVELGLGVAAVGLRTGGVAGFGLPAVPDQLADDRGSGEVPAVVARVHRDHLAAENPGAGRAEQFRAAAGGILLRLAPTLRCYPVPASRWPGRVAGSLRWEDGGGGAAEDGGWAVACGADAPALQPQTSAAAAGSAHAIRRIRIPYSNRPAARSGAPWGPRWPRRHS